MPSTRNDERSPFHGQLTRRECLRLAGLTGLASVATNVGPAEAEEPAAPKRRIFVTGGGLLVGDPERRLLRHVISLTGKPDPIIYNLPTASGDNLERVVLWYEIMNTLPCRPRHIRLSGPTRAARNFEKQLLAADAIVVPGGNGLNMMAVWKAQGVDQILRKAWEKGIVLSGESAGMICWFEQTVSDSRPEQLTLLEGLGWLKGSACAHYNNEPDRKTLFHQWMIDGRLKDGIACDDGAGVLFEGDRLAKVVSISSQANAYLLKRNGSRVDEERLEAEMLGGSH